MRADAALKQQRSRTLPLFRSMQTAYIHKCAAAEVPSHFQPGLTVKLRLLIEKGGFVIEAPGDGRAAVAVMSGPVFCWLQPVSLHVDVAVLWQRQSLKVIPLAQLYGALHALPNALQVQAAVGVPVQPPAPWGGL
ncbi:hypothetical protein HaLaN_22349, partial [Haematococcus lacustris]